MKMKASDLVKHLQKAIKKEGDLPVMVSTDGEILHDCAGFVISMSNKDKSINFMLCDHDTMDAFT